MRRIRHLPEKVILKLREADAEMAKGTAIPEICRVFGTAEIAYYYRRDQFGGIEADETKRLEEPEGEDALPQVQMADPAPDKAILESCPGELMGPFLRGRPRTNPHCQSSSHCNGTLPRLRLMV